MFVFYISPRTKCFTRKKNTDLISIYPFLSQAAILHFRHNVGLDLPLSRNVRVGPKLGQFSPI